MRLDLALVEKGLARSRNQAARLICAGRVTINGRVVTKPSLGINDETIEVETERYVSRAAYKLVGALDESATTVTGRVLDAGASTGGFTQVSLERGAQRVYAVDVGHGQLAQELRTDPRVVVREGLNLRDLELGHLEGQPVDLIVGDVSFISLTMLVEPLSRAIVPGGIALLLVKPQFEVGRAALGRNGVVRDHHQRENALAEVVQAAEQVGWHCDWSGSSVLAGSQGNQESFVRLIASHGSDTGCEAQNSSRVDP